MNPYQIITDRIVKALEGGTIPWRKPWTCAGFGPTNLVSKKAYRGVNVLLLEGAFESPYWMTFNQARNLGGHVLKGETSTPVVFWKIGKYEAEDEDGESETKSSFLLRYYHVFNSEQTSLAAAVREKMKIDAKETPVEIPTCEQVVKGFKYGPEIKHRAGSRCFYTPLLDTVTMATKAQFDSPEHYYATLYHELCHATGHAKRLNREGIGKGAASFGSEKYGKEELVAEIGSAFLCGLTGISKPSTEENTTAYLQNWIKAIKGDNRLVVSAAAAAQSAVDHIRGIERPAAKPEERMAA